MKKFYFLLLVLLAGCDSPELAAPDGPAKVKQVPTDWATEKAARDAAKLQYLDKHQIAYQWFANFPFSETDDTPFILLKLLPKISPELWGSKENFLDVVGLYIDDRQKDFPAPFGIGFSGLSNTDNSRIDYASVTCGACHAGRVQLDNGQFQYLDGAANTTFNFSLFREKTYQTFNKITSPNPVADNTENNKKIMDVILSTLDKVHHEDPTYFYNNYSFGNKVFNAEYEAKQIELFKQQAAVIIPKYIKRVENYKRGFNALLKKNYPTFTAEMTSGFPGMVDATGLSAANAYVNLKQKPVISWFASIVLPPTPGITDFMSVWDQGERKAHWNHNNTELIDGGGQWNGSVPIPMYRNIAALSTLGLENTDIRIAAFAEELLDGLPATAYPFAVDIDLAKKGQDLFTRHCADCHQPHNGKVYANLGTDMARAKVVNRLIAHGARSGFLEACSLDTEIDLAGKTVKPCAEFEGVSLKGKDELTMRPVSQQRGYNARPLSGVWAQAPYLHNGSIPTLYHLLVAGERPQQFTRGVEKYDQEKLGFAWEPELAAQGEGVLMDTNAIPALSRLGHSGTIVDGSKSYKLDWSDDKEGAKALLEYLKVL